MREKLILIWRKITQIKILTPFIIFIRYFAGTNFFNSILDFAEVNLFHTSYQTTQQFIKCNKQRIKQILQILEDEKSKKVYQCIWKYRATHNRKYLKGIVDKQQYFDSELIQLGEQEGFVDCGAYKGDTIKQFLKRLPHKKYQFIVAFEPDEYNFKKLSKYLQKNKHTRTCTPGGGLLYYKLGTWHEKTCLRFKGNTEEGCKIADDGDTVIYTDTIDAVVGNQKVTYIKMDVEGAELNSLIGAKEIIKREHPKLAISIYHSDDDMINVIEYIRQNYPFYKLYVRHYTYFYADTVLYAIEDKNE